MSIQHLAASRKRVCCVSATNDILDHITVEGAITGVSPDHVT
jgi:hypothetical protein